VFSPQPVFNRLDSNYNGVRALHHSCARRASLCRYPAASASLCTSLNAAGAFWSLRRYPAVSAAASSDPLSSSTTAFCVGSLQFVFWKYGFAGWFLCGVFGLWGILYVTCRVAACDNCSTGCLKMVEFLCCTGYRREGYTSADIFWPKLVIIFTLFGLWYVRDACCTQSCRVIGACSSL
jgi:hypothetical protein